MSTMSRSAKASSSVRMVSMSTEAGSATVAVAWNSGPPDIGALTVSVVQLLDAGSNRGQCRRDGMQKTGSIGADEGTTRSVARSARVLHRCDRR